MLCKGWPAEIFFLTDRANYFNYINMTHPDTSGMLRFLTDELQDAEDKGDRGTSNPLPHFSLLTASRRLVWIVGHVLTGWDGTNPLRNPTNLCSSAFMLCICALLTYAPHSSLSDVCLTFLLDLKICSHIWFLAAWTVSLLTLSLVRWLQPKIILDADVLILLSIGIFFGQ